MSLQEEFEYLDAVTINREYYGGEILEGTKAAFIRALKDAGKGRPCARVKIIELPEKRDGLQYQPGAEVTVHLSALTRR